MRTPSVLVSSLDVLKAFSFSTRDDLVINLCVQHFRNKSCADTLNLVRAGFSFGKHRGSCRLNSHDLHFRLLALQELTDTGYGSAGTNTSYENVNSTLGVIPDLRAGGLSVNLRVCRVVELSRDEAVLNGCCQLICLGDGPFMPLAPSVRTISAP